MKKLFLYILFISICGFSQQQKLIYSIEYLPSFTTAQLDSIATKKNPSALLQGITAWNSTLGSIMTWNGLSYIPLNIPNTLSGAASITSNSSAINTTETVIVKTSPLFANRLILGTTIRITAFGTNTSTISNRNTFAIRIGTTGTITDGLMLLDNSLFSAATGTNNPFKVVIELTITSVGATATCSGSVMIINNGILGIMATATGNIIDIPTFTAFNTTMANNIISFTYKSAATTTTTTFQNAQIEFVYK